VWAILSDVHANLAAFAAALDDAQALGAVRYFVLGDLVGYGPDPIECIDRARQLADVNLLGNFELALAADEGMDGWSAVSAIKSIRWTRGVVGPERRAYLAGLPRTYGENGLLFLHGSTRNPIHEYLFPEDIYNPPKMQAIFKLAGRLTFCGHTHIPGTFVRIASDTFDWIDPAELPIIPAGGESLTVNVGSVGQPRDGDPRAGYVLFDGNQITFRRVDYDVKSTAARITAIPELDDVLAEGLFEGR
jgi:diadenosine tetraphosphatase ApaH/serine/threonine PP2A family protein phosphatase